MQPRCKKNSKQGKKDTQTLLGHRILKSPDISNFIYLS